MKRFWRAVALFAMKRADLGHSPPLRFYRVSDPTFTANTTGANVTVKWTQT